LSGQRPFRTRSHASECWPGPTSANGYQHDSISHAVATIERLGRESGAYDTFIRTDSQLITKHPITFPAGTGIATGETFNVRNLDYFDAIFFFGVREIDLSAQQRADLLSFVKDDGKGFVAAHSAATAFFSWPEFGEMLGGPLRRAPLEHHRRHRYRRRSHVSGDAASATCVGVPRRAVPDQGFLAREDPRARASRRVEARSHRSLVHRKDADFPAVWAKTYGKGRVFYSILGHEAEDWDNPTLNKMYFEAIRWALKLVDGDATPRPLLRP